MKLLHLDASILGANSVSRELSATLVGALQKQFPDLEVNYRDLVLEEIPHLSPEILNASYIIEEQRTPLQRRELARGEALIEEFLASDIIVLGAPMYNFGLPTQLKAWFDRILVAGRTFKYTQDGPVGLAGAKRVYLLLAHGGRYQEEAMRIHDHQEPHLKTLFGFVGITDIEVIRAEGLAFGEEAKAAAIKAALEEIKKLKF